jgi:hypothetical protein
MSLPNLLTFPTSSPGPTWTLVSADSPLSAPVAGQFDPNVQENRGTPIWQKRPGIAGAPPWIKYTGENVSELTFEFLAIAVNSIDTYPMLAWNRLNELAKPDDTVGRPPRVIFTHGPMIAEGFITAIPTAPIAYWGNSGTVKSRLVRQVGPIRITITRIPKDPTVVSLFTNFVQQTEETTYESLSRIQYGDARYAQSVRDWNQGNTTGDQIELPRKSSRVIEETVEEPVYLSDPIEGL